MTTEMQNNYKKTQIDHKETQNQREMHNNYNGMQNNCNVCVSCVGDVVGPSAPPGPLFHNLPMSHLPLNAT